MNASFRTEILRTFSSDFLSEKPEDLQTYGRDWTKVFAPRPAAIVFPRTTDEVSRFLKLCHQFEVAVVPSGGRTGLAGGAVAANGEVVLSLVRMNRMDPVDPLSHTVRVQAGAITEAVHHHCEPHGLTWPIDFASKGSSHVGGNIATNAGGVRVIHYGMARQWVLGLQVVTMTGEVLELNGALEKNNTGIDLRQLFIGSEGVLGVITEATLKLARLPRALDVFFFAVDGIPSVLRLFQEARRGPFTLMAFECLTRNCLEAVTQVRGLQDPFAQPAPAYVLMEVERPESPDGQQILDDWLGSLFENSLVKDGTLAQSPREARDLWSLREGVAESIYHLGFLHKNDISVPVARLEAFIAEMEEMFRTQHSDLAVYFFGHIGDGNLHVNTMMPKGMERDVFLNKCHETDRDLFGLVRKYEGSISAEHGIGLLKKGDLHYSRSTVELEYFRVMKRMLDPKGLLNPGKIFELSAGRS
jgi:FAD/FMN-containing dehydrogenase